MSRIMGFIHDRVEGDGHAVEYFSAEQVPAWLGARSRRFAFPWLVWRHAVRAARAGRPYDVVNVHEPSAAVVALGKRTAGHPYIVVTSHGVEDRGWAVTREERALGREAVSLKRRLAHPPTVLWPSRLGFRRADHVFCLNEEDRAYIRQVYRVRPDRITRMFPGADPAYTAVYPRRDYATADRVVFFGTWLARKGTADLVAAFTRLATRHPGLQLQVIGAGFPAEVVLRSFPEPLRGRVECVPPGPAEGYADRMLGAAVYVVPSLFEGTPLTLMEAMATGLPVVGTSTCGMRDVIRDGANGFLVPVRDPAALAAALDRLLTDAALRERLGRQAHADVMARYTWDAVAEPVRNVYRRLAEQRAGRPTDPRGGLRSKLCGTF
jgi:glycosyltransferase involved in cell wall biosynthesis